MVSPIRLDKWQNIVGVSWDGPMIAAASFTVIQIDFVQSSASLACSPTTVFAGGVAFPGATPALGEGERFEFSLSSGSVSKIIRNTDGSYRTQSVAIGASQGVAVSGLPSGPSERINDFYDDYSEQFSHFGNEGQPPLVLPDFPGFIAAPHAGSSIPIDYAVTNKNPIYCSASVLPLGGVGTATRAPASSVDSPGLRSLSLAGTSVSYKGKTFSPAGYGAPHKYYETTTGSGGVGTTYYDYYSLSVIYLMDA